MDSEYLCNHLKKLVDLVHGGDTFAELNERGKYVFGNEKVRNVVTKEIAIYLSIEKIPQHETIQTKKRKRTKNKH
jgi:hypothetical protein